MKTEVSQTVRIPCKLCGKTYELSLEQRLFDSIEKFPFPILVMHTATWGEKEVHTSIAYIDREHKTRHVEILNGHRVFITPYIIYNPALLSVYLYRV